MIQKLNSIKKNAIVDILKVTLSNVCSLVSGILIGFLIPKILGYEDYGFYKTFVLYSSYLGLLHFGISDGVYFIFAGKRKEELDKRKIHSVLLFIFFLELFFSTVGVGISSFFINISKYGVAFLFVSIYCVFLNMENIYSGLCQATRDFGFISWVGIIKSCTNIAYVITFYCLVKSFNISNINFTTFCILPILVSVISDVLYTIRLRNFIFTNGENFDALLKDLKNYMIAGIPLLLANLTTQLIMTCDKQIIAIFYPVEQSNIFSIFSFAYSMLSLITVATNAIGTVLYPYMRDKNTNILISNFSEMYSIIVTFTAFACLSFFFLDWFVGAFLSKYNDAIPIFRILLPGLVINTPVTVLMHSYYKTLNKEKVYFIQNILALLLAIISDIFGYYFITLKYSPNNPIAIVIASVVVIALWYVMSESYLVKHYKIKHWKNDIYLLIIVIGFYLIAFLSSKWIGFSIYLLFVVVITILVYFKEISQFLKRKVR
jgi:O-antigen/teichoic acid export membrane protein